jgi:hypothetical protein
MMIMGLTMILPMSGTAAMLLVMFHAHAQLQQIPAGGI